MRHIALEAGRQNAAHHAVPLHFLRIVQFVPSGNASGVEVAQPLDVLLHGAYQGSLHDLHVINVIKQLHARRVHRFHHAHSPCGVVAHIVFVIHLVIEKLQGAEITREAAREGADVIINYNSHRAAAEAVLLEVQRLGRRGILCQADVGVKAETDALVAAGLKAFGKIDVLVNNAGIALWKPFLELDESNWDRTLQTNLKSVFLCSQAVARHLVGRKSPGSIVNISSIAAAGALDCLVPYCASKGGMLLITKAMATELAPYNIRVNSVAPGTIDIARNRQTDPNYPDDWLPFIPMGRVGVPSDMAKPVIFLASDEAAYVTGQTFWVDGGETSYVPMPRADFAR